MTAWEGVLQGDTARGWHVETEDGAVYLGESLEVLRGKRVRGAVSDMARYRDGQDTGMKRRMVAICEAD